MGGPLAGGGLAFSRPAALTCALLGMWLASGCSGESAPAGTVVEEVPAKPGPKAELPAAAPGQGQVARAGGAAIDTGKVTPSAVPEPDVKRDDPELKAMLAKVAYKKDPYASEAGCVAQPDSRLRDELLLWTHLRVRADDDALEVVEREYAVTTGAYGMPEATLPRPGIPRFEVVYDSGRVLGSDLVGRFRPTADGPEVSTEDQVPADLGAVTRWSGRAVITPDVALHRITLDGKVLAEVGRPAAPPRLGSLGCDPGFGDGLQLRWRASQKGEGPLLVDIMRHAPKGFVEILPSTDARHLDRVTLAVDKLGAKGTRDVVMLVSVTDTFRLLSRGLLIPVAAL